MPHQSDHQAINFYDSIIVQNYTEEAPHLATYQFPCSVGVEEHPFGFLESSGDGGGGTFYFNCEFTFGRYNVDEEQFQNIISLSSTGGTTDVFPLSNSRRDIMFPQLTTPGDMGANDNSTFSGNCNIKSTDEILRFFYEDTGDITTDTSESEIESLINGYELIGLRVLQLYFLGETNETQLQISFNGFNSGFKYYIDTENPVDSGDLFTVVGNTIRTTPTYESTEEPLPEETDEEEFLNYEDLTFSDEGFSSNFGVPGISIEQTLLTPFDSFSGLNINTSIFQNTNQSLLNSNQDGRIELGMFSFNDDNIAKDNFPNILGPPFSSINKENLVNNGDCKFVEKVLCRFHVSESRTESTLYPNNTPIVVKPEGDWGFLSLKTIQDENTLEAYEAGVDSQDFKGYGGRYTYVPFSHENEKGDGGGDVGIDSYWGNIYNGLKNNGYSNSLYEYFISNHPGGRQGLINQSLQNGTLGSARGGVQWQQLDTSTMREQPHVAMWLNTPEAYSNNRCLCFTNKQIWNTYRMDKFVYNSAPNYTFNYLTTDASHDKGNIIGYPGSEPNYILANQYRVLNQFTKIYDKFNDSKINPYSSLIIKFKMKTTEVYPPLNTIDDSDDYNTFRTDPLNEELGMAPQVDVGILHSQFNEIPLPDTDGINYRPGTTNFRDIEEEFQSPGSFNSIRYPNGETFEDQEHSPLGGMGRFQNTIMSEWQDFEFKFNLTGEHINRGLIYGVPYGGAFDDEANNGAVEMMINYNSSGTNGTPGANDGEIYFKIPGYQNNPPPSFFRLIHPNGTSVSFQHGPYNNGNDYNIVATGLGDAGNEADQRTGLQPNGKYLEAYVMYVDSVASSQITMHGDLKYGHGTLQSVDVVLAYWNGENWTYDNNTGYSESRTFRPNENCFILARVYSSEQEGTTGITGMDQYIDNEIDFPTDGIGNLFLFLQSGNDFNGRVLIDNIECYESYEFTPEVDVRKKISVNNYGAADLTKYYDKELQPDEYKDTTAPLEAQFYFYPQYPTNETFVQRTPIYQDFKKGRFYIYDVDWGDGSPNEFTNTPEQIDENTALYHTYETHGIFEVTGTMLRVKVNKDNEIQGVIHNKKFKLRININPGADEDFQYFGSDGFSFIPYKNTIPIIGGLSKQSAYYKSVKRQLGFLSLYRKVKDASYFSTNLEEFPFYFQEFDYNGDGQIDALDGENWISVQRSDIYSYLNNIFIENNMNLDSDTLIKGQQTLIPETKINIEFKNNSDKLKTELALLKMENQDLNDLEVLPAYMIPRYSTEYNLGDNETKTWPGPDLAISSETMPDEIIRIDRSDGVGAALSSNQGWVGNLLDDGLETGKEYTFQLNVDFMTWDKLPPLALIYKGISPIREELGKGIGDCDLTSIKYYNEPKSIWELFGFNDKDSDVNLVAREGEFINRRTKNLVPAGTLYHIHPNDGPMEGAVHNPNIQGGTEGHDYFDNTIGLPTSNRYWKNIIPKDYSIFNREGLGGDLIDTYSEQDWMNSSYYPVLPKLGQDGKFIDVIDGEGNYILNTYPNNKIPFPLEGAITNENESKQSLLINFYNEKLEPDVLADGSGNENIGLSIRDFTPIFEDETLRVKKSKNKFIYKTSKQNGAF